MSPAVWPTSTASHRNRRRTPLVWPMTSMCRQPSAGLGWARTQPRPLAPQPLPGAVPPAPGPQPGPRPSAPAGGAATQALLAPEVEVARPVSPLGASTPPPPPDLRAATQADVAAKFPAIPAYVQEAMAHQVWQARQFHVVEDIERWTAERLTLNQIADRLRQAKRVGTLNKFDTRDMVNGVRAFLGIPSQKQRGEFNAWHDAYHGARQRETMVEQGMNQPPLTPEQAALETQLLQDLEGSLVPPAAGPEFDS